MCKIKKIAFKSPRIIILSDSSCVLTIDHSSFFQNDLSELGGRYMQQRNIHVLEVVSLISIHIHFSQDVLQHVKNRSNTNIIMNSYLSEKIVLKPSIEISSVKILESNCDSVEHKIS